ncbi:L-threonylcarbamoyladenylate synthase [Spirosoma rhododendri]|uniref:Threonylcarbamoyl-AMP synthase n=1 Tax=Spirosoma rhododendri TaxID=2728024 RepID=A0A7L5DM44_9BACT|nr:L-threonylcarbamoyladenylate synthase [Spirosoma rhododendri]QJD79486.1 threonylcarbamoyl-AMP synthase [Spirosoma rhododendri]
MKTQIGQDVVQVGQLLAAGQVVGIPTETVYGLAGNALDPDAVLTIFRVKNRPAFDPLILHTNSIDRLHDYVTEIPPPARQLAEAFWPGPLTLLLPKHERVPDLVTSGLPMVAVRVPNHPLTLALLASLDFPLAAPSANPFGYISPTTAQHVADQLGEQVPYILDGGPATVGLESTIVGFEQGKPVVYRLGGMALDQIEAVVGPVDVRSHSTSNPKAPGMLSSHYAPRVPLTLLPMGSNPEPSLRAGALAFRQPFSGIPAAQQRILSETGNLAEAARNLFAHLRQLDALDLDLIYAETVPSQGLGTAINDRLRRAAVR